MKLEFLDGSNRARLLEGIEIQGYFIEAGFVFNGANIPIWTVPLVWLTRWHPKIRKASCVHDFLYGIGHKDRGDVAFRRQLKEDGANFWQVAVCYWAVRLFGGRKKI